MGFFCEFCVRLGHVVGGIKPIREMHKNRHLLRSPVHALNLILHLEAIILGEVYMGQDGIFREVFHGQVALSVLPSCNEVVDYKLHEFRL
jgi:hypothetical protein